MKIFAINSPWDLTVALQGRSAVFQAVREGLGWDFCLRHVAPSEQAAGGEVGQPLGTQHPVPEDTHVPSGRGDKSPARRLT